MRRWWWLLLVVGLLMPSRQVQAEGAGFTVTPQLPANQIGGNTGWFNLLVKPGQAQDLTVTVGNQSAAAKQLRLTLTNAFTQDNGQIGYAPNQKRDSAAKVQLTALGSPAVTVNLAAHQGRRVTFRIRVPQAGFPGQVLGAIYVRDETKPAASAQSGFAVTNAFAMVVAVQLQTSEKLVPPRLHLRAVKAQKDRIQATIQNAAPRLFGKMTLKSQIIPAGQQKAVATQKDTNYAMAPTSAFTYQLRPAATLAAGRYRLVLDATAGTYHWHWTRNFTLQAPVVAPTPPATGTQPAMPWWPWVLAMLLVLLLGILIGWWRGRQHKEET